jgi:RNA polymerase sigma factor (sigma-70 family)
LIGRYDDGRVAVDPDDITMTRMRDYGAAADEASQSEPPPVCVEMPTVTVAQEPFAEIYHQHAALLRLIAVRDYRVPFGDAEPIVNDIFTRYFANPGVVRGELKPYFRGAVRNECLEYWRRQKREQALFSGDADADTIAEDSSLAEAIAQRLAMGQVLSRLRPKCREALQRFHLEGKSSADVAAEMNVAPLYVRQLLHACRKAARALYESITRVAS